MSALNATIAASRSTRTKLNRRLPGVAQLAGSRTRATPSAHHCRRMLVPAVLGTGVFIYGGLVFIRGARRELADHKAGMKTPISLAIIADFPWRCAECRTTGRAR
jgi:cation transport ATPase